jgi:hypothetical protein
MAAANGHTETAKALIAALLADGANVDGSSKSGTVLLDSSTSRASGEHFVA